MSSPTAPKLSRWEIVGAWLHVWTAPKGMEVPPVPVRKLVLGGLAAGVAIGVALALLIPPLERAKAKGAAERARQQAVADAKEAARLRADQIPHTLVVPPGRSLVATLQAAITADARGRVRKHTMTGKISGTTCTASPGYVTLYPHSRVYKCTAENDVKVPGFIKGDEFGTGYAFVATIYPGKRRLVWCKENPHPDEKGARNSNHVAVSPRCAGKLSQVL